LILACLVVVTRTQDITNVTCDDVSRTGIGPNITLNVAALQPDAKYLSIAFGVVFTSILVFIFGLYILLKIKTERLGRFGEICVNYGGVVLSACPPRGWDPDRILKYRLIQISVGIVFLMIALFSYSEVAITASAARKFDSRPMKLCWKGRLPTNNVSNTQDTIWQAMVVLRYYGSGINKNRLITLATCPDLTCHTASTRDVITLQLWIEWLQVDQVYTGRVFGTDDYNAHLTTTYNINAYAVAVCFFVLFGCCFLTACFGNNLYVQYQEHKHHARVSPSRV